MRRSERSRMRSGTAARRDREQISRLRPRLLSKKITVRQRLYNLRIVARQAQPEDANGPPKNEGEDLPRRGRRGRQDLPHPTIHPRPVRRPVHLDARREAREDDRVAFVVDGLLLGAIVERPCSWILIVAGSIVSSEDRVNFLREHLEPM